MKIGRLAAVLTGAGCLALGCGETAGLVDSPGLVQESGGDGMAGAGDGSVDVALTEGSKGIDATKNRDQDALTQSDSQTDAMTDGETGAPPDAVDELAGKAARTPTSCLDVQSQNPDAGSGLYEISLAGRSVIAYCDMALGPGGWTTFFVDHLGPTNVVGHFDALDSSGNPLDYCPSPASLCLRHIPIEVTTANQFAVRCGNDAVQFQAPVAVIRYWKLGASSVDVSSWQPLSSAVAIAGQPDTALVTQYWTGLGYQSPTYQGWIVAANDRRHTFASASSFGGWEFCNDVDYTDAGADADMPMVWLLYR